MDEKEKQLKAVVSDILDAFSRHKLKKGESFVLMLQMIGMDIAMADDKQAKVMLEILGEFSKAIAKKHAEMRKQEGEG